MAPVAPIAPLTPVRPRGPEQCRNNINESLCFKMILPHAVVWEPVWNNGDQWGTKAAKTAPPLRWSRTHLIYHLSTTPPTILNGIQIHSTVLPQYRRVTRQTDRPTDEQNDRSFDGMFNHYRAYPQSSIFENIISCRDLYIIEISAANNIFESRLPQMESPTVLYTEVDAH